MSRYREIYNQLEEKTTNGTWFPTGKSYYTDDLLREAGIDAMPADNRNSGLEAAVIYLAERVKKLEEELEHRC